MTVPEQLAEVAFGRCGNPDFGKAFREHQIEDEPGVALIGLLLAHFTGADLRGVSNPEFVTEFREQALEPMNRTSGFDAYTNRLLQTAVERMSFAAFVVQSPLEKQLSRGFFRHGNLLIACVKITSYNQHCSAPFPEPWSFQQLPSLLGRRSRRRHPITPSQL